MFKWTPDFERRLRELPEDLAEDIVGVLQGLIVDPNIIYVKSEFVWTRRDDIGPKAVQVVVKDAVGKNLTVVVHFETGEMVGVFVKDDDHLTPEDIVDARRNYDEAIAAIGSNPTIWGRRSI